MKYYWTKKNGNFKRQTSFGDEMPSLPKEEIDRLLKQGFISDKQPANFDDASINELAELKNQSAALTEENAALKRENQKLKSQVSESSQSASELSDLKKSAKEADGLKERVAELEAELEDVPKNVRSANAKIKKLEKEISDLTDPKGGK